mgnify:CR=1 FL=1
MISMGKIVQTKVLEHKTTSLRKNEGMHILNSNSEAVNPNFKHYNGEEAKENFLSLYRSKNE